MPQRPHNRPLDDRLTAHEPRLVRGTQRDPLVKSRPSVRIDRTDEITAAAVGALILQRVAEHGQTHILPKSVADLIEKLTVGMTAEEVMKVEVEAYEIVDWLVGPAPIDEDHERAVARRSGDTIVYDPAAPTVELIQRAIDEKFDLRIDYFSRRRGEMNTRRITPNAIAAETYILAYCHARQADRVFRLNRITRCIPVNGTAVRADSHVVDPHSTTESAPPAQLTLLEDD